MGVHYQAHCAAVDTAPELQARADEGESADLHHTHNSQRVCACGELAHVCPPGCSTLRERGAAEPGTVARLEDVLRDWMKADDRVARHDSMVEPEDMISQWDGNELPLRFSWEVTTSTAPTKSTRTPAHESHHPRTDSTHSRLAQSGVAVLPQTAGEERDLPTHDEQYSFAHDREFLQWTSTHGLARVGGGAAHAEDEFDAHFDETWAHEHDEHHHRAAQADAAVPRAQRSIGFGEVCAESDEHRQLAREPGLEDSAATLPGLFMRARNTCLSPLRMLACHMLLSRADTSKRKDIGDRVLRPMLSMSDLLA